MNMNDIIGLAGLTILLVYWLWKSKNLVSVLVIIGLLVAGVVFANLIVESERVTGYWVLTCLLVVLILIGAARLERHFSKRKTVKVSNG